MKGAWNELHYTAFKGVAGGIIIWGVDVRSREAERKCGLDIVSETWGFTVGCKLSVWKKTGTEGRLEVVSSD